MLKSCTRRYSDESGEGMFRFLFYCDRCQSPYRAIETPFGGGAPPGGGAERELWRLRWQTEHALAFQRANHAAQYHFFACPGCGEFVCADCTAKKRGSDGALRETCLSCCRRTGSRKDPAMRMVTPPAPVEPERPSPTAPKKRWRIWKRKTDFPR